MIITIWVPFTVLTFEVNREFKQPTFLSDVVQPEVSLFLFNICLGSTKFLLLSVFFFKETIYPKICSKSRLRCAKSSLPVDARRSKTSLPVLLKIMTENGTNSPPMKVISNTILFVYSLRGALIKIARGCHTSLCNYFNGITPYIIASLPIRYLVAFSYPDYSKLNSNWHTAWPVPDICAKPYQPGVGRYL